MKNQFKVEIIGKDLLGRNQLILSDQKATQQEVTTISEPAFQHPQIQKKQFIPMKEQEFMNILEIKKPEFNKLQIMLNHKKKTIDLNSQRNLNEQKHSVFQRKDNTFGLKRHSEQLEIIGNKNVYNELKNNEMYNPYDFRNPVLQAGQSIKTLKFSNTSEEVLKNDGANIKVDDPDKLNQIWLKNLVKKDFQFQKNFQKISVPINNMLNKLPLIKDESKNQDNYGVNIENQNQLTHRRKTIQAANQVNNILSKLDSHRKILKQQNKDYLPELMDMKYSMSENKIQQNIQQIVKSEYSDKTFKQNKFVSLINFSGNEENQDYIQKERQALSLKLKNKGSFRQASVLTKKKGKKDGNRFHFTKLNPDGLYNQVSTKRDQGSDSPFDSNLDQLKANMNRLKNEIQNQFKAQDEVDEYFIDPSLKNQSKHTQNNSQIMHQENQKDLMNDQADNDYFHIEDQKNPKTRQGEHKKENEEIDESKMMSLVRQNNNNLIKTMGNSQATNHPSTSKQGSKKSIQKFSEINVNVPNDSRTININSPIANSTHTSKRNGSFRNQSYEYQYSTKNIQKEKIEIEEQSQLLQPQTEKPIEVNEQFQIEKMMVIEENSVMNSKQIITKSQSAQDIQENLESNYNSIYQQMNLRKQSVEPSTNDLNLQYANYQGSNANDHQSQVSQQYLENKFQMLNKQSDFNVVSQNDFNQIKINQDNKSQEVEQKIVAQGINLNDKSQQTNLMKQDPLIIQTQNKKREKIESIYQIIMHRNENSKHEENFTQKLMEKGMSMADQLKQQRNLQEFKNLLKKKKQKESIMQDKRNKEKRLSNETQKQNLNR